MLRITESISLALHAMVLLVNSQSPVTTKEMASQMGVSEAHLSKVLQTLVRTGFLRSIRGPAGGFVLARKPDEITLLSIWEAVGGPFRVRTCLLEKPICGGRCIFGGLLEQTGAQVKRYFASTTLAAFRR